MKLVKCTSCKGKHQNQPLTIGKIYEVLESKDLGSWCEHYLINDETGFEGWYSSAMFNGLTEQEIREYKLTKIL